jgi:hypothetical protein
LLAQAYQQVFPQARQSLSNVQIHGGSCGSSTQPSTAARLAKGA